VRLCCVLSLVSVHSEMKTVLIVLFLLCVSFSVIVSSEQKPSAMVTGKMDDKGEYISIRGINFISMATGLWRDEVFHAVQDHAPILGKYINPLPGNSYHMTVHPLFTEHFFPDFFKKKFASDWDNMWTHIMNLVTPHICELQKDLPGPLHPEYLRPLVGNGVTVLVLRLPREEAANMSIFRARIRDTIGKEMLELLLRHAKTVDDRTAAKDWYEQVFVEHTNVGSAMTYKYHLTLGYSRWPAEKLTTEQLNALDEESDMVDAVVRNLVCPDYEKPGDRCVLNLEAPTFDWFTSMTAFDEIKPSGNPKKHHSVNMFFRVFPVSDDVYESHLLRTVVWCLIIVASCSVVAWLYCKRKGRRPSSKSSILPLTSSKFSQDHEA